MKTIVSSLLMGLLLFSIAGAFGVASEIYYFGDNTKYHYMWNVDPIPVYVIQHDELTPEELQLTYDAIKIWQWKLRQSSDNVNAWNVIYKSCSYVDWAQDECGDGIHIILHDTFEGAYGVAICSGSHETQNILDCDIHVGVRKIWSEGGQKYIDISWKDYFTTVMHEFGHSIGLGHTINDNGIEPTDLLWNGASIIDGTYKYLSKEHKNSFNKIHLPSELDIQAIINIYGNDGFGNSNIDEIPFSYSLNNTITQGNRDTNVFIQDNQQCDLRTEPIVNYNPCVLRVSRGDTVTWTNQDNSEKYCTTNGKKCGRHTVTSGSIYDKEWGNLFDSLIIKPNGSFSVTFDETGIYNYHCRLMPWMKGKIIVE